jgi:hypothetical protein
MLNKLNNNKGMAMIVVIPILLMITILGISAVFNSNTDMDISGSVKRSSQAFYIAEAGLERAINEYIWGNFFDENVSPMTGPFDWLESLDDSLFYEDVSLGSSATYSVRVLSVDDPGPQSPYIDCRDVTVEASAKAKGGSENTTLVATMRFGVLPSGVFDYSYFINHFGWWAGFASGKVNINGNAKANGHFDVLSGKMTINGSPRYDPITGEAVDNGGVYAGGYVFPTDGSAFEGMASEDVNRYSYAGVDRGPIDPAKTTMPNLNDAGDLDGDGKVNELSPYYVNLSNGEYDNPAGKVGIDKNGDGTLQPGEVIVTGAFGDDPGETGNLALTGTDANPIIIEGTIAVTNDLAISGVISGQGSFYTGRNTYVGSGVEYDNPTTERPVFDYGTETPESYKTRVDTWKDDNESADLVSFMTVNNIVCGNHTESKWQSSITKSGGWLKDYRNNGYEDVGADGVFGSLNNEDNPYAASEKEADGFFTVSIADGDGNQHVEDLPISGNVAQVPPGYHIVPGTGEDVDGDGLYGGKYSYGSDINFDDAFNSANFYNLDPSVTSYSDFAEFAVNKMDGIFYTNHALAGHFKDDIEFNGSVVARNEAMVTHNGGVTMNHDERLSSKYQDLIDMNIYMPLTKSFSTVSWEDKSVH